MVERKSRKRKPVSSYKGVDSIHESFSHDLITFQRPHLLYYHTGRLGFQYRGEGTDIQSIKTADTNILHMVKEIEENVTH